MILIDLNKIKKNKLIFDQAGEFLVYFKNLSGRYFFEIKSQNVDLKIFGLYQGKNKDCFQIETIQHHLAPFSRSSLLIKGVFDDASIFFHKGLIRIEKNGQKSHAYQKTQSLVLSPYVFVNSKPELEIMANDVYCTHGSTTGCLENELIYYLKTRGLTRKKAEKLLINGFLKEVDKKVE